MALTNALNYTVHLYRPAHWDSSLPFVSRPSATTQTKPPSKTHVASMQLTSSITSMHFITTCYANWDVQENHGLTDAAPVRSPIRPGNEPANPIALLPFCFTTVILPAQQGATGLTGDSTSIAQILETWRFWAFSIHIIYISFPAPKQIQEPSIASKITRNMMKYKKY